MSLFSPAQIEQYTDEDAGGYDAFYHTISEFGTKYHTDMFGRSICGWFPNKDWVAMDISISDIEATNTDTLLFEARKELIEKLRALEVALVTTTHIPSNYEHLVHYFYSEGSTDGEYSAEKLIQSTINYFSTDVHDLYIEYYSNNEAQDE